MRPSNPQGIPNTFGIAKPNDDEYCVGRAPAVQTNSQGEVYNRVEYKQLARDTYIAECQEPYSYPLYDKWMSITRKSQKRLKVEALSRSASKADAAQSVTADPKADQSAPQTAQSASVSATSPLKDTLRAKAPQMRQSIISNG